MKQGPRTNARRIAMTAAGVVALLAGACSPDSRTEPGASESPAAAAFPANVPAAASTAGTVATESAGGEAAIDTAALLGETPKLISCATERGASAAGTLVRQCRAVSPATHPPCNVANSCATIRNEIARGCALLGEDAAKTPDCRIDPISREAAADMVERYYAAINAHDHAAAWQLWGPDGNHEHTFDEFSKGYRETRRTRVEIGEVSSVEGGAGSIYVTVPVTVNAELNDGRRQRFTGSYSLRQINRGMGPSQGWHITTATLRPS